MIQILLSLALFASAEDTWNPSARFEERFKSSVNRFTQARPPAPSNLRGAAARTADDALREAGWIALSQGMSSDATFEADPAAVGEIMELLISMRARYPEIAALRAADPSGTSMILGLTPRGESVAAALAPIPEGSWKGEARPAALGLPELDALVSSLGGAYRLTTYKSGGQILVVEFGKELDWGKLSARMRTLPDVQAAGANAMVIGGAGKPAVEKVDGRWRVTLTHGWGDCMAGCINRETWYFASGDAGPRWLSYTRSAGDTVVITPSAP